ncbi:hypothetical protein V6N13_114466 [Hibiscus sabdariffa]
MSKHPSTGSALAGGNLMHLDSSNPEPGCGSRNFIRVTKQYMRDQRPDICILVETRVSQMRADSVIASLGFPNSHRIEAIRFSGGIWLCWFDIVQVTVLANQFQFIHYRVNSVDSSDSFLATFVYASPNRRFRYQLWHYIEQLAIFIMDPWVILGDFNATLTVADRRGCSSNSPEPSLSDMVFNCGLMDLGFSGPAFTWYSGS